MESIPLPEKHTKSSLFDMARPFTAGSSTDEVELKFDDGQSLFVSKAFLMYASPVFELMFQSDFKEKESNCITLKGKSYRTFLQMLLHIHPRIMKQITGENARQIYAVAHEYQMSAVLENCGDVIIRTAEAKPFSKYAIRNADDSSFDIAFDLLQFAEKYNDSKITSGLVKCIARVPIEYISRHPAYKSLTDTSKNLILERRLQRCETREFYYDSDRSDFSDY